MTHFLKIWPGAFEAVASGVKTHEIRFCGDRDFKAGDSVVLQEWNPGIYEEALANTRKAGKIEAEEEAKARAYTGRNILRRITYVSIGGSWGLPADICVFSMKA